MQQPSTHLMGQKFSKAFDATFKNKDEKEEKTNVFGGIEKITAYCWMRASQEDQEDGKCFVFGRKTKS